MQDILVTFCAEAPGQLTAALVADLPGRKWCAACALA